MKANTLILIEQLDEDLIIVHGHFAEGTTPQDAAKILGTTIVRSNGAGEHHLRRKQGVLAPLFLQSIGALIEGPLPRVS